MGVLRQEKEARKLCQVQHLNPCKRQVQFAVVVNLRGMGSGVKSAANLAQDQHSRKVQLLLLLLRQEKEARKLCQVQHLNPCKRRVQFAVVVNLRGMGSGVKSAASLAQDQHS